MTWIKAISPSIKGVLIYTLCHCFVASSIAQNEAFHFNHITVKDGLSQGSTTGIVQDSDGYIWIGTYNGLNRYNGYDLSVFRSITGDTTSLASNVITSLLVDNKGNLWVGTYGGLHKYDASTESFHRFTSSVNSLNTPDNTGVFSIIQSRDEKIWCGTWGGGIFSLDTENNTMETFQLGTFPTLTENSNLVRDLYEDASGNLFVCTWGDGLVQFDPKQKTAKRFHNNPDDASSIPNDFVWSIAEYSKGQYIVATQNGYVSSFFPDKSTFQQIQSINAITTKDASDIYSLKTDKSGYVWIGTYNVGIIIYHPKLNTIRQITKTHHAYSLSSNRIKDIYFSPDSDLTWISTSDGVNLLDPYLGKFKSFTFNDLPNQHFNFDCQDFLYTKSGSVWVATWGLGIWEFQPHTERFLPQKSYHTTPKLTDKNVLCLAADDKLIYAGTRHGVNAINTTQLNIIQHRANYLIRDKLSNNFVRCAMVDQAQQIWFGTDAGLELHNTLSGTFKLYKPYKSKNPEALENLILSIAEDPDHNLLVGTDGGGLCIFDPLNKLFTKKYLKSTEPNSLSDNRVLSFCIDAKKRIWVGTSNGLNLFDPIKQTFSEVSKNASLSNSIVYAIEEDDEGHLWFSTAGSLVHFDTEKLTFREYNHLDGLAIDEFITGSSLKLPSGQLLFGGINGFCMFHPDSIITSMRIPPIVFTQIKILNKPIHEFVRKNGQTIIQSAINKTKEINLKYTENSITFEFAALDFSLPAKNKYTCLLENFDTDWKSIDSDRTATYTSLPAGTYIFRVKASINDGLLTPVERSITIHIQPPFYQSIWFRSGIILMILVLGIVYLNWRTQYLKNQKYKLQFLVKERTKALNETNVLLEEKQEEIEVQRDEILLQKQALEKHQLVLEKQVKERTQDLDLARKKAEESEKLKSAFLANMSHEIRTPMNAITGFSAMLNAPDITPDEQNRFIGYIKQNSESLLVLIDDILDISQIESGQLHIRKELFKITNPIVEIVQQFQEKIKDRPLTIQANFSAEVTNTVVFTDSFRIKQVLRNLLDNAIKFSHQGVINVKLSKSQIDKSEAIKIEVEDPGIGIPEDKLSIVFDRFTKVDSNQNKHFTGAGLGLAISKRIIELLGGRIWVESEVNTLTRFTLLIPINQTGGNAQAVSGTNTLQSIDWRNKKILIVEDDPVNYQFLASIISKVNGQVIWAKNGFEALALFENNRDMNVGIIDIKIPEMTGIEFLSRVKEQTLSSGKIPPFIAHTAFTRDYTTKQFLEAGFTACIYKPIKPDEFLLEVDKIIT